MDFRKVSLLMSLAMMSAFFAGCDINKASAPQPYRVYVSSPKLGEDAYKTFSDIREYIHNLPASNKVNGVEVLVESGVYYFSKTLTFDKKDAINSTNGARIVFRALDPLNHPVFTKSQILSPSQFTQVADPAIVKSFMPSARGKVLVADISNIEFKWPKNRAFFKRDVRAPLAVPELYCNGETMKLSVWPNEGWSEIVKITDKGFQKHSGEVGAALGYKKDGKPAEKEEIRGGAFIYSEDRPSQWVGKKDLMLHGFWCYDWYDSVTPVLDIDPVKKEIRLEAPHTYGVKQGNPSPRRWKALNVVDEVDMEGEYAVDLMAKKLYFIPPKGCDFKNAIIRITGRDGSIVQFANARDITFDGIDIVESYASGLSIENSDSIQIRNCLIKNIRSSAVKMANCKRCVISSCDISSVGTSGVILSGGNRKTLERGDNIVENCRIHDFSQKCLTYASAIHMHGVGNTARNNELYNAVHMAVGIRGNDHTFEYNIVSNVCMSSDDAAALYKGRDPSCCGNMIRYNFFSEIGSPRGHGNAAIYFDDGDCCDFVIGNVFYKCGEPGFGGFGSVFSHGGHSNLVQNCIFIECKRPLGSAPWVQKRWESFLASPLLTTRLKEDVSISNPPYTTHYPLLDATLKLDESLRKNLALDTVFVKCPESLPDRKKGSTRPGILCGNWVTNSTSMVIAEDPGFVNYSQKNFALRKDSVVYKNIPTFKEIPFSKIGLTSKEGRPEEKYKAK
jgi:hypothetical protein